MNYKLTEIGSLCKLVTSGGTPLTSNRSFYEPKDIPWLKTAEVNYCRIYDTENYISEEGLRRSSAKLIPANSVIVAMYGQGNTAGKVAINKIPLSTNQACCNLVIDEKKADYRFVYYALSTLYEKMVMLKNGGAQPNLNAGLIKSIEVPFPDLRTQTKIADVLSVYDDLIENYKKQIRLLVESAQRIYREWFVDFRFPNYEQTKKEGEIPIGWNHGVLDDIAVDVGVREKRENRDRYKYYLPIECLPKKSLSYHEMNDISLAESSLVAFKPKDILFGSMRPYFHKVVVARDEGLTRSTCFVINSKQDVMREYLTLLLFDADTIDYATQISVGTTMPYVRWKDFVNMPVLIPTVDVCRKFSEIVEPMISKANCLAEGIIKTSEARNRLLTKLISGEIEL